MATSVMKSQASTAPTSLLANKKLATNKNNLKFLNTANASSLLKKSPLIKQLANIQSQVAISASNDGTPKAQARKNITQLMCESRKLRDDELELKAESVRIEVLRDKLASKTCKVQAVTIDTTISRFDRYGDALPFAHATNEMNKLGDNKDSSAAQYKRTQNCISLLPIDDTKKLNSELKLPAGTISPEMLRNDKTGFRAGIFRDEATGKLILTGRDTQPNSMVDWMTNTRSGDGLDTPQYKAMKELAKELKSNNINFNASGYSKGGGFAQLVGLINKGATVKVFNSAGLHKNALQGTDFNNFSHLESRTRSYSSEGDFLTFMNNTTNPQQQITNGEFLRNELAGEGNGINPLEIKYRNPAMKKSSDEKGWFAADPDPAFEQDKKAYLKEMDTMIQGYRDMLNEGKPFQMFPTVRSGHHETIINSESTLAKHLPFAGKIDANEPNLAKLIQHKMTAVLDPMEESVKDDRLILNKFVDHCK